MSNPNMPAGLNEVLTKDALNQDIFSWRDLISNTLTALEKVKSHLFKNNRMSYRR